MEKKIVVNGSLIPSVKNAPLDIRTRINTIEEVESIQVPFIGMIFYVMDEEKFYVVKSLKGSKIGNISLEDTTIDVFEPLVKVEVDNVEVDLSAYATIEQVEELIAAIEHPQYDDTEIKDAIENKVDKVEGKVLIDEAEVERLANVDNYDDSEIRVLIDEEKPYLADVAAYPTSKFLFACGQPMTVEPNVNHKYSADHAEDDVAFVYRWAEGFECIMVEKAVAEKVYLVGGFGNENVGARRSIPQTNMKVRDVKIKGLVGGNYFEGMVGHVNIEAENCEFVAVMGGGWCGASVNGKATRMNVADDINIKMTNCKVSSTLFGGSQGNGVSDDLRMELNNCEIGWLTAGGSNGMTRNAVVVMNGGSVKVAQSTNRGVVHKARFILNDGVVNKLYFGGETEDASVNGLIEDAFVELNGGIVKQFNFGTDNGVEIAAENIKGCIMDCVVESGDVSMLEVKVKEEEIEIDLSEYAKTAYVDEQIAEIELKEGPMGPQGEQGAAFTYDMFTQEQLEALRGPQGIQGEPGEQGLQGEQGIQGPRGEQGPQGPQGMQGERGEQGPQGEPGKDGKDGIDGRTPVKGVDYFTEEEKVEMLSGYATQLFVQEEIAKAQLEDSEVDLSAYATITHVQEQINAIEHPQYDDSEIKERIEVLEAIDHEEFLKEHQDISHLTTKAEVKKLHQRKYEVSGLPEGTLVNYSEKEIRVMCPEGTEFHTQQVGAGGLSNRYYMTMTMFAPEGAVTFREGAQGVLEDEIRTVSNGKRSRWFSLAILNEETGEWTYRGAESTAENCIGWTNIVEWYDAEDKVISRETIRINLANEECFDKVAPIYNEPVATKEFVEEQIANVELIPGPQGPQGEQGPAGQDGKDGQDGAAFTYDMFTEEQLAALVGPQGPEGIQGPVGPQGEQGIQGEQGPQGEVGPQGPEGLKGDTGEQGPQGPQGPEGPAGKDFTYDMFTEEQLEALRGPAGQDGQNGQDGANGVDGKDFTYDMFTEEQLEALRGPEGPAGKNGEKGADGVNGQDGAQGVSVTKVEIVDNHLMVTLSDDQVLDAGEMPAGSGSGMTEEEKTELESLRAIKQEVLDLTYGVEYEWIYYDVQTSASITELCFNQETAPGFYEDWLPVLETGDDALIEEFIVRMYEEDIYRMYVLRCAADPKRDNRYYMFPLEDHAKQELDPFVPLYTPVTSLTSWNWGGEADGGFTIDARPTSAMVFAFMKVKEEYRLK